MLQATAAWRPAAAAGAGGGSKRLPLPLTTAPCLPPACRVVENLGLLSNDEVLAVLKDREADKQPVISRATTSEIQVRSCFPKVVTLRSWPGCLWLFVLPRRLPSCPAGIH